MPIPPIEKKLPALDQMMQIHVKNQHIQDTLSQLNLAEKHRIRKFWEVASKKFAENLQGQAKVPFWDLIGQGVCAALGIGFSKKTQEWLFEHSRKSLETISSFFQNYGKSAVEIFDRYVTLSHFEPKGHELQFLERTQEIDLSQNQELQRQADAIIEKSIDIIRLHLSMEKSLRETQ